MDPRIAGGRQLTDVSAATAANLTKMLATTHRPVAELALSSQEPGPSFCKCDLDLTSESPQWATFTPPCQ